ncbi:hypothetical protein FA13DRAFT_59791 [Coprinellus micaceus]|uniref:Uncharacterized protein n=1 Tax=Coprinellus micaceus TaxID=71717 RepID=A0A4Y7U1A0_COPMI|nr:hypothetical protein FA13DRAFT_59791 [Coprinellus micaceus]
MPSSVLRIPPEVISRFIQYLCGGVLDLKGRQQLTRLCLVCQDWRDAALLSQELWKGIRIEPNHCSGHLTFEIIVSWFERWGRPSSSTLGMETGVRATPRTTRKGIQDVTLPSCGRHGIGC